MAQSEERKSVAVDFDGVIHQWDGVWRGYHVCEGEPMEGALPWLHTLLQTYDVFILTTRGKTFRGRIAVKIWMRVHTPDHMWYHGAERGLRGIRVTDRKKPAVMYIDDRGFRFEGDNFPSANRIRAARPWWRETSVG